MNLEIAGFLYGILKDLTEYFTWKEEEKLVDNSWLEKTELQKLTIQNGYELRWSLPDKIEARKLDGWEILYEVDKLKRIKRRIVLVDKSVLLRRKITNEKN